jgi:hypothetical protein
MTNDAYAAAQTGRHFELVQFKSKQTAGYKQTGGSNNSAASTQNAAMKILQCVLDISKDAG